MKPIDDNETPDDFTDEIDEITADVEEEDFDIEIEIKRKRKSRGGVRRTTGKEYGTLLSFIAWMAFTIIWLFFFASGYGLIENIAVVFVAFLVVGAASALVWIPRHEGLRVKASAISGIGWIVFLILWIVFAQGYFGLYENIGIALASLLVVGLLNMLLHVPGHGDEGGARISGAAGILWLIFIVLWLPFSNDFATTVYFITFYQNLAIILGSFLLMTFIVIAPWFGKMQISVNESISVGNRPKGTLGIFWGWLLFLVVWLWFMADTYTANQNVAAVLLSFAVFCGIVMAFWLPWARKRGEGPESWFSIGLSFTWVIILTIWFWFFADQFDAYQNFAVFLVSLLVIAGIAAGAQWKKYRDFEAMDWTD
ncbi:hypothetical protein EU528_04290 [Candidatus Thorarchaeota archaeon]|nr:MAG: hypothetical protein EU528_04290 [Candidatus Thorarchaeota archaeon]